MNRAPFFLAGVISVVLLVSAPVSALQQDAVGEIKKITGPVYWQQGANTPEVQLDTETDLRRPLIPGERYRCGSKGKLELKLYGKRVRLNERMGWFPIPYASLKGKDGAKKIEVKEGATGGRLSSFETESVSPPGISTPQEYRAMQMWRMAPEYSQLRYSVIEYPAFKEVTVPLKRVASDEGLSGTARVTRYDASTRIQFSWADESVDFNSMSLYAVDEFENVTALRPIETVGRTRTFVTPLTKFMIIGAGSPGTNFSYKGPKLLFSSTVPEGFAVITPANSDYQTLSAKVGNFFPTETLGAPMLNIPEYKKNADTKLRVNLTGALSGTRASVFITPRQGGPTEVKLLFHELHDAPAGEVFTVWAVSPVNSFVKLGQIITKGGGKEAEVRAELILPDFGILLTSEAISSTSTTPVGPIVGIVEIVK